MNTHHHVFTGFFMYLCEDGGLQMACDTRLVEQETQNTGVV